MKAQSKSSVIIPSIRRLLTEPSCSHLHRIRRPLVKKAKKNDEGLVLGWDKRSSHEDVNDLDDASSMNNQGPGAAVNGE